MRTRSLSDSLRMAAKESLMWVSIEVTDRKNKYPPKVYEIEVEDGSAEFLWYGDAIKKFIADNNHPPYKPGTSSSVYYSRFWAKVMSR